MSEDIDVINTVLTFDTIVKEREKKEIEKLNKKKGKYGK